MILNGIERRIRLAGILVFSALMIEVAGLLWKHPLSFALAHMLAIGLLVLGTAVYLLSLLPSDSTNPPER